MSKELSNQFESLRLIDLKLITYEFLDELGVVDWGYNQEDNSTSFSYFKIWSESQDSAPLKYLQDHRADLRESLSKVFPEFQSSLTFLFSYKPSDLNMKSKQEKGPESATQSLKIANYVLGYEGEDYHFSLRERLDKIAKKLSQSGYYKTSLDIEPILERDLAMRSGLGWFGKNSMLINQKHGSYFLIGSILFDEKAIAAPQINIDVDHCGNCTACIDQCPTLAIKPNTRTVVASKCISTFTIETFKEKDPPQGYANTSEIFGCDICQDVCPWNRKVLKNSEPIRGEKAQLIEAFFFKRPLEDVIHELESISNREFRRRFHKTSLERTGRIGILKNLKPFLK